MVLTIHDVNHLALPDLLGGLVRRSYARWLFQMAARRARRVLFDSEFTRQEAARLLGELAAKGTVVHLGVNGRWTHARELAPERPVAEPYFVYVGNMKRHKNVAFLVRAFARIRDRIPHHLVLLGRTAGLRADPDVAREVAKSGDRVRMIGEVDDAAVLRHVAHADALVTASLYEGFGLPALEAMAAGCPCVVSRAGSLPEVCGDAAYYANPRDEGSFAAAMLEVALSAGLRDTLARAGRARAADFSWERAADATVNVLEQALA
jgi:glycosyltransferase involved in cell wall biosynthesis